MATIVVMPKLSPTMEEGVLLKWTKKVGDTISVPAPGGDRSYEILSVTFI